jgi:hypothetical protein
MSVDRGATYNPEPLLENIAAELTTAVYPLVLRHALRGSWLDLELGLWRALAETVENWVRQAPRSGSPDELDVWRGCFLVELTGKAFHVALTHGVKASLQRRGWDLYGAFRSVIERDFGRAPMRCHARRARRSARPEVTPAKETKPCR